jgi:hypothetical protein
MIHMYLKTIDGKMYTVVMDPTFPLAKLKEVVMETTGIAKEDLRLVHRQRQLTDLDETKSINDCYIEDHAVIYVIKRWKKCSCVLETNMKCVQNDKKDSTD